MMALSPIPCRNILFVAPLVLFPLCCHLLHHTASAFSAKTNNAVTTVKNAPLLQQLSSSSLLTNKHVCISGGGPCGLFLALLLIQHDPTVQITILEKSKRRGGKGNINAFGIGLGTRLLHSLDDVPGLRQKVESVGAKCNFGLKIISRTDLSEQMTLFLENKTTTKNFGCGKKHDNQCQIRFGEGCAHVDIKSKFVTTTLGHKIHYDLLVGADGIHSTVRRTLVEERGLAEEHYLEPALWKTLRLPPQPDFDAGSTQGLHHSVLRGGHLLPRYPEGHIILAFWDGNNNKDTGGINPGNLDTVDDLKSMITDALQDIPPKQRGSQNSSKCDNNGAVCSGNKRKNIFFDNEAIDVFLQTPPGRSHYMKVDRFHDDSVALIGDAAHGMNAALGQGCAVGLNDARILVEELGGDPGGAGEVDKALQCYSKRAVPDAHAITDLNRVANMLVTAGPVMRVLVFPILMVQKMMGRTLFKQVGKIDVTYKQIWKENWLLLPFEQYWWRRERVPFMAKSTTSVSAVQVE